MPPGYRSHYLGGEELDEREAQTLYRMLQLEAFISKHESLAPRQDRALLFERLAALTAHERALLKLQLGALGQERQLRRALGPESDAYLGATPPQAVELPEDGSRAPEGGEVPASRSRFEGDTLFQQLFSRQLGNHTIAESEKLALLARLQQLSNPAFDELAATTENNNAWSALESVLGGELAQLVGAKHHQRLARAIDAPLTEDTRALALAMVARLCAFERRSLAAEIERRGTAGQLTAGLGAELGALLRLPPIAERPAKEADAEAPDRTAALAAARRLSVPVLRALRDELRDHGRDAAVARAIAREEATFVAEYSAAVGSRAPHHDQRRLALAALAAIELGPLESLLVEESHTTTVAPQGDSRFEALFRPLLGDKPVTPEQRSSTLDAIGGLHARELTALLRPLTADDWDRLSTALGPRFKQLVQDCYYDPLRRLLDRFPPEAAAPPAEASATLAFLDGIGPIAAEALLARMRQAGTVEWLASLLGPPLEAIVGQRSAPAQRSRLRVALTDLQRSTAVAALREMTPHGFAAVLEDCPPELVWRFAHGALEDAAEEPLGRALLLHLPSVEPAAAPSSQEAAERALRALFERVITAHRQPPPQRAAAEAKAEGNRREPEEEALDHHGLGLHALYRRLMSKHLELDGEPPATAEERLRTVEEFEALPPILRQAVVDQIQAEGTGAKLVSALGGAFARTLRVETRLLQTRHEHDRGAGPRDERPPLELSPNERRKLDEE